MEVTRAEVKRAADVVGQGGFKMTTQPLPARKITVTREMIQKAVRCNQTWMELHVAIQTHLRIEIQPDVRPKGDSPWQPA